ISTALIFPALSTVLTPDADVYSLIKPQFEAGREKVGKKGVVRESETHIEVIRAFIKNAESSGFSVKGVTWSPIKGPEGNIEVLAHLKLDGKSSEEIDIEAVVNEAHERLKTV
ncbi:MAG: TlyA family RNA methyltransferase, partial [Oscillospiraceae bacterium]|nr:TlyA family RNA methyltransferase [Oscillospiraceae bacterium]